jgi:hypothetical protein
MQRLVLILIALIAAATFITTFTAGTPSEGAALESQSTEEVAAAAP